MAVDIVTYKNSLETDLIDVFNRENRDFELVVQLTPRIFREQIRAKSSFDPAGCFLAFNGSRAVGFALTCRGVSAGGTAVEPAVGVIDGLFFPSTDLECGRALLCAAIQHVVRRGARRIYGFASFGGYPFWRGLYVGAEPVCLTDYKHAWIGFMAQGFRHHQQSLNYLGATRSLASRGDLTYEVEDLDVSAPRSADSWRGLAPKVLKAYRAAEVAGRIGYVELPHLSDHRGVCTSGIYSMSVSENYRRQGIASALMARLFEMCGNKGTQEILVGTTVENTAARCTYEKAGMKVVAFRSGTMKDLESPA